MLLVDERVDCVGDEERIDGPREVAESLGVVFLGVRLDVGPFVGEADGDKAQVGVLPVDPDVHHLVDLPNFNAEPDEAADTDEGVGLVIQHVQEHDERLEHVEKDGAHGKALQRLSLTPKLDVVLKGQKLKDAVHYRHDESDGQQVGIRVEHRFLERILILVHPGVSSTRFAVKKGTQRSSLGPLVLHRLGRVDLPFEHGQRLPRQPQWHRLDARIKRLVVLD